MDQSLLLSESLSPPLQWLALGAVALSLLGLLVESRRSSSRRGLLLLSGLLGLTALAAAVLRPARLSERSEQGDARVLVLLDASHRMQLPGDSGSETRALVAEQALADLRREMPAARLEVYEFAEGAPVLRESAVSGDSPSKTARPPMVHSDLSAALEQTLAAPGEPPSAAVVLSDGRLSGAFGSGALPKQAPSYLSGVPVHFVGVASEVPEDRSLLVVSSSGTAIAHQPFRLHIEVACRPAESCDDASIAVHELIEGAPAPLLASGKLDGKGELRKLDLEVTIERAGQRALAVELTGPTDDFPANDRRLLPIQVRRDRTRMLHVAGRPTYDVRALRSFLKADASIDLISFFILRTRTDQLNARQEELSLIPFPVEELFTDHLPSFDAVVLQDIDARKYELDRHFVSIRNYVKKGGGLIMVGGPSAFSAGGYQGSPVGEVLPVDLPAAGDFVSRKELVPAYTAGGRAAPILAPLRRLLDERLPAMSGANILGAPRPGALVLWEHPEHKIWTPSGERPAPLLAVSEVGDGRSIALAVDATHKLGFGAPEQTAAGEAHPALWEGLLGWLMRDPRYESAQVRLDGPCLSGTSASLLVTPLPTMLSEPQIELSSLGGAETASTLKLAAPVKEGRRYRFALEEIEAGGYAARVVLGDAPATRFVFVCEEGGEAFADTRPDPAALQRLAKLLGGSYASADDVGRLPPPEPAALVAARTAVPILPAWAWALLAALLLAAHWLLRRAGGLP